MGMSRGYNGGGIAWGFRSIEDWVQSQFLAFPAPWSVAPLEGKYYGTGILDARGAEILTLWLTYGESSSREDEKDEHYDTHWESEVALKTAELIVLLRNQINADEEDRLTRLLSSILISVGEFNLSAVEELRNGGGPARRPIESDPEIACTLPWRRAESGR